MNELRSLIAIGWPLLALLGAMSLTRAAIVYAHRRGMLDQPGRRRSHAMPTPRGGGIGLVVAMLICVPGALWTLPQGWPANVVASVPAAVLLVALAGWWDDHRSLPVLPRLGMQLIAVCGFLFCLDVGTSWWYLAILLGAGLWSINLHNFMDGIDGLLAQQVMFVCAGLALIAWWQSQPGLAIAATSVATAALGFWYYNRSPARIFMGDVGSGSAGLAIFVVAAMLWRLDHDLLWPVLILASAFVIDASLTLLIRICRGRRWYAPHREHLYQWLVRRGLTHAQVDVRYMLWNIAVAGPATWLACSHLRLAMPITIGVYLITAIVWLGLKRRCLRRHLTKDRHVTA